jgi:hypothetical protein
MRALTLLTVLALAFFTDAIAQEQPLQPGQRVRVTAPTLDMDRHEETFQQLRGDTLVVISTRCPLSDVARLEEYRGRKLWGWWKGGLIGLAVGAGAGLAVGASSDCTSWDQSEEWCTGVGAGIGAGAGLLVGTAVGFAIKTDRWEDVPLDRVRVGVVSERDGFGIMASIAF